MKNEVEFVSYPGKYPCLCLGILTIRINGKQVELPRYCCVSGGECYIDSEGEDCIIQGNWTVNVPEELAEYKEQIETVMNRCVRQGCCGGCL